MAAKIAIKRFIFGTQSVETRKRSTYNQDNNNGRRQKLFCKNITTVNS